MTAAVRILSNVVLLVWKISNSFSLAGRKKALWDCHIMYQCIGVLYPLYCSGYIEMYTYVCVDTV